MVNPVLAGLYIEGQWRSGGEQLTVINPSTEERLAIVTGGVRGRWMTRFGRRVQPLMRGREPPARRGR